MKKNYLFGMLALAAMTMVSCSNDEVVNDYSQDNAIQFGTYVGRDASSRAIVIDNAKLATDGFGVFAYYTKQEKFDIDKHVEANFMNNQEVKNTYGWNAQTEKYNGAWTYDPVKYWPNNVDDKVSFFAYAPYSSDKSNVTVDLKEPLTGVKFTINAEVNDQTDFLWARPVLNLSKNSKNPIDINDKVEFAFYHALSRIGFKVQTMIDKVNPDKDGDLDDDTSGNGKELDEKNTKVMIKKVTLSGGFYAEANLVWTKGTDGNYIAAVVPTEKEAIKSFSLDYENHFVDVSETPFNANGDKVKGQSVNQEEKVLNKDESYMMIIPQEFDEKNPLTITVDYDVITADNKLVNKYSYVNNVIETSFPFKFEASKAYVFSLHLGLTTVKLTAKVDGWQETEYAVNVPINTTNSSTSNEGVVDEPSVY